MNTNATVKNILKMPIPMRIQMLLRLAKIKQKEIAAAMNRSEAMVSLVIHGKGKSLPVQKKIRELLKKQGFEISNEQLWFNIENNKKG